MIKLPIWLFVVMCAFDVLGVIAAFIWWVVDHIKN